jgi:hypothetical protein
MKDKIVNTALGKQQKYTGIQGFLGYKPKARF